LLFVRSHFAELKEKVGRAEKEREQRESISATQRQLLEYHKQITLQKIKAVEEKYSCIKKINIGLEVHIIKPLFL